MKVWVKCDLKNIVGTLFNVVMELVYKLGLEGMGFVIS